MSVNIMINGVGVSMAKKHMRDIKNASRVLDHNTRKMASKEQLDYLEYLCFQLGKKPPDFIVTSMAARRNIAKYKRELAKKNSVKLD